MATRSNVTIDGINLYSHWDGYPSGTAVKIYKAIENAVIVDGSVKHVDFVNAFIAGNKDNCKINLEKDIGGIEYSYKINSKTMTIGAYEVNMDTEERTPIFLGDLFDFMKQYTIVNGEYTLEDQKIFMTTETNSYNNTETKRFYTEKTIASLTKYVTARIGKFDETNPNKKVYQEQLDSLMNAQVIQA